MILIISKTLCVITMLIYSRKKILSEIQSFLGLLIRHLRSIRIVWVHVFKLMNVKELFLIWILTRRRERMGTPLYFFKNAGIQLLILYTSLWTRFGLTILLYLLLIILSLWWSLRLINLNLSLNLDLFLYVMLFIRWFQRLLSQNQAVAWWYYFSISVQFYSR